MKMTSGGTLNLVWPLTTRAKLDFPIADVLVSRVKYKVLCQSQESYYRVDFPLKAMHGGRSIRQDRLLVLEQNQCSISEEILSKASQ